MFMCSTIKNLISDWLQTRKFSQLLPFTVAFDFSHHGHALVTFYVQLLCSDWLKFDRWFHSENLCSILKLVFCNNWSWQSFVSICEVFNCRFPSGCTRWNTAGIKSLLLFMARLLFSFSLRKSSLVKVGNPISYRFRLSPCLVKDQRVEKSQAILALLDSFQELHLEW